ncbi:hypothetical protein [Caulobacter sp. 17J80-11]|uniref:hypothetical protein n=1 Tax=Caulobacter sp. 17J80-11 TaxID=2763502 RepID=UPI00165353E7|nr:hypothetical protein [Caulobacter sp. 17J80-11]MBC6982336.1 hypothetical protein [Caulobacter sp. 17J80-11]
MNVKSLAVVAALAVAPALSGCVIVAADTDADVRVTTPASSRFESIYGAQFDERGFSARLNSNGCTTKDTVEARVDRSGARPKIAVVRLKPDNCRAFMREGVWLTWSLEELGLSKEQVVEVQNSFMPW